MRLPAEFYHRVQSNARRKIEEESLDGLLVTTPADIAYLVGFFYAVTERPVYLWFGADGTQFVLIPELDENYAEDQGIHAEVVTYFEFPGVTTPESRLAQELRYRGTVRGRIGVSSGLSIGAIGKLESALPTAEFVATNLVSAMRIVKEPEEIVFHRRAAAICDDMLAAGRALIEEALAAGNILPTEGALAREVIAYGTDRMYADFDHVIYTTKLAGGLVYAGPNSARPHGLPSSRTIRRGDTLILSLGAAVASRFVESERTFVIGEPSERQRELYETTQLAQHIGTEALQAGTSCAEANRICLDVIRDSGLGAYIRHRQGHGIGIAQHEAPWIEDGDQTLLTPGMIVSSEPGIYVPGFAGFRISDSVLITESGPERLTRYPRGLEENVILI